MMKLHHHARYLLFVAFILSLVALMMVREREVVTWILLLLSFALMVAYSFASQGLEGVVAGVVGSGVSLLMLALEERSAPAAYIFACLSVLLAVWGVACAAAPAPPPAPTPAPRPARTYIRLPSSCPSCG